MNKVLPIVLGFFCFGLNSQVKKEIFESFKLQESRDVSYYFPEEYNEARKHPLIVVLDADYLFDLVVANSKFFTKYYNFPASIVVGVHQEENDIRLEDCDFDQLSGLPSDKGKLFYEFLGTELVPYLETSFNIAPFKMFVGYDITANFGNYFLFKNKSFFNAYLMISPVLGTKMEERIPARLSNLNQEIFYHLVLEREYTEDRDRILQMNNAIKILEKER